jgi:hypothetical protein
MIRTLASLFALTITLFITSTTQAQGIQRTFVSTSGTDTGNCNPNAPCRTFSYALTQTAVNGEIIALTSGGYGAVNINKAVQITAPTGVYVAITAFSGDAITVNAAGATVVLRGLTLNGLGATNGINVTAVGTLQIENCVVNGFSHGIYFATAGELIISDTVSRNNIGTGLIVSAGTNNIRVTVSGSRFENNTGEGIDLDEGNITASITNSILSNNGNNGLEVDPIGGGVARVQVTSTTASNNGAIGFLLAGGGAHRLTIEFSTASGNTNSGMQVINSSAILTVSNSVATHNSIGFSRTSGTFESRGNNTVRHNTTTDTSGGITVISST